MRVAKCAEIVNKLERGPVCFAPSRKYDCARCSAWRRAVPDSGLMERSTATSRGRYCRRSLRALFLRGRAGVGSIGRSCSDRRRSRSRTEISPAIRSARIRLSAVRSGFLRAARDLPFFVCTFGDAPGRRPSSDRGNLIRPQLPFNIKRPRSCRSRCIAARAKYCCSSIAVKTWVRTASSSDGISTLRIGLSRAQRCRTAYPKNFERACRS